MKKTNLKSALIVAAIAISGFGAWKVSCIYENENKRYTSMMIQNIEALANGDEDPWADCPRNQYIRNAKEYWKAYTVKYDADLGFHISVNGKNIKLGLALMLAELYLCRHVQILTEIAVRRVIKTNRSGMLNR